MIPQVMTVRVDRPVGRPLRLWVPVLPVLVVCAPIVLLVVLGAAVACLVHRISVLRALGLGWGIFSALPGTRVDIAQGHTTVLVTIR